MVLFIAVSLKSKTYQEFFKISLSVVLFFVLISIFIRKFILLRLYNQSDITGFIVDASYI